VVETELTSFLRFLGNHSIYLTMAISDTKESTEQVQEDEEERVVSLIFYTIKPIKTNKITNKGVLSLLILLVR
jgi:hypothetical protein